MKIRLNKFLMNILIVFIIRLELITSQCYVIFKNY
jgi:hypothetical protein